MVAQQDGNCHDPSKTEIEYKGTSFLTAPKNKLDEKFEAEMSDESESRRCCGVCSESTQKTFLGLLIVIFLAVSWVGAQQFAQSAQFSGNFSAPYFTTWFSTCWMVLCFPVFSLFLFFQKNHEEFHAEILDSRHIFGPENVTLKKIFTHIFSFNVLWIFVNYLYVFSLTYIAATDASAILSSNVAFVYALSFIILGEHFYFIRTVASSLCIAGVVMFGYADGFVGGSNLVPGIVMALLSAVGAAVYKVLFKRMIGEGKLGQVSLFLSLLGLTNALFLWVVFLILYFVGLEKMVADEIPWGYLCGSSSLSLVFNFLVNFGIAFTYPLFISIAMMLGIPLNAAVDMLLRGEIFSLLRLIAALLVVAGFCMMMCPDSWNLPVHRALGCKSSRCYGNQTNNDEEEEDILPITYSSGDLKPHEVTSQENLIEVDPSVHA
ncbi:solute carrier family 35 member F3-like isoform X2 [Clavelina lepadiformis]